MTSQPVPDTQNVDLETFERLSQRFRDCRDAVEAVVFGQSQVIDEVLATLLAGGHNLLEGPPGLAKTRLVSTLGTVMGLETARVQFTPDLMPTDILGAEILEESASGDRAFRFIQGPVFCQLLMADEINRASPRTQSALLEAMQERQVTVAGARRQLPQPFHVLATQNPIDQEGTYPLPEAQLDRFLLKTRVTFPDQDAEREMVLATTGPAEAPPAQVLDPATLQEAQALIRAMPLGDALLDSIIALVRLARPGGAVADHLKWGPGPRASQALSLVVRAKAFLRGEMAPSHKDLAEIAPAVLRHRMALTYAARGERRTVEGLIDEMLATVL